jgi:putative transposase
MNVPHMAPKPDKTQNEIRKVSFINPPSPLCPLSHPERRARNGKEAMNGIISKADFPFLKDAESTSLQQCLKHVGLAVKRYFMHLGGRPNYVSKKHRQSMTVCAVGNNIRISDEKHVRLPKIGDVRFVYHRPLPSKSRITSACVSKEVDGRFFVSIHVEFDEVIPNRLLDPKNAVGLDYKSDGLYVSSDGVLANMPHCFREGPMESEAEAKEAVKNEIRI